MKNDWLAGWPIAGWLLRLAGDGCGSRVEGGFSPAALRRSRTTNLRRSQELGQHRENPSAQALFGESQMQDDPTYTLNYESKSLVTWNLFFLASELSLGCLGIFGFSFQLEIFGLRSLARKSGAAWGIGWWKQRESVEIKQITLLQNTE